MSSLQISVRDNVGQPYQIAITGTVSDPSMTSPNRQTYSPRLSQVCIRAQLDVVPIGKDSEGVSDTAVPLVGEYFPVDGV